MKGGKENGEGIQREAGEEARRMARMAEALKKDGMNVRSIATGPKAEVVRIVTSDPEKSRKSLSQ